MPLLVPFDGKAMYKELQERIQAQRRTWLVTGPAGFIGSNIVEVLLKLDQNVVGVDNFSTGKRDNLSQVKEAVTERLWLNFRLIEGDIRSIDACRQGCRSANFVLHHAALGSVPRSVADPVGSHDNNVAGFFPLLVAAHNCGVSPPLSSSSSATHCHNPKNAQTGDEIRKTPT